MENNLSDEKVWPTLGVLKASALQRDYFSLPKRAGYFQPGNVAEPCHVAYVLIPGLKIMLFRPLVLDFKILLYLKLLPFTLVFLSSLVSFMHGSASDPSV
jgi:hypothetical protein